MCPMIYKLMVVCKWKCLQFTYTHRRLAAFSEPISATNVSFRVLSFLFLWVMACPPQLVLKSSLSVGLLNVPTLVPSGLLICSSMPLRGLLVSMVTVTTNVSTL